jgi:hypothetical protein
MVHLLFVADPLYRVVERAALGSTADGLLTTAMLTHIAGLQLERP